MRIRGWRGRGGRANMIGGTEVSYENSLVIIANRIMGGIEVR